MPEVADAPIQKAPPVWEQLGAFQNTPQQPSEPAKEESSTDTKVEVKEVPQVVVDPKRDMMEKVPEKPLSPKGQENWAKVRESLKQKEAELADRDAKLKEYEQRETALKTEFETTKTRIQELEQKLSTSNPDDFTAKEQKYQQELDTLRGELKLVALERDPEFIAKFDTPKTHLQNTLQELAITTGTTQEDFQRAIRLGQDEKLDEIRDSLTPHLQRKWDAALTQIEQVNLQRDIALKDKETTYNAINQKRQAEYQSNLTQRSQQQISLARQLAREPFEKIEALKGNTELQAEIEKDLVALAGGEGSDKFSVENIFREFAASRVQRVVLQNQHAIINEMQAKNAELEAEKSRLEAFIQEKHGNLPSNEVTATEKKEDTKPRPLWERVGEATHGKSNEFI